MLALCITAGLAILITLLLGALVIWGALYLLARAIFGRADNW